MSAIEEKLEELPPSRPSVGLTYDLHHRHGYHPFAVTLTSPDADGFSKAQERAIKDWHINNSDQCLLSRELHGSGLPHFHSYVTVKNKQPAGLTRKLKTLYKQMDMPWSHNAVKVVTAYEPSGWYGYCWKDLAEDERPLLIKGFALSWIKSEALAAIKVREEKRKGRNPDDPFILGSKNVVRIMLEFAKKKSAPVVDKQTYAQLVALMMEDNYSFDRIRHEQIYCQLRCREGSHSAAISMVLGKLNFIDD